MLNQLIHIVSLHCTVLCDFNANNVRIRALFSMLNQLEKV